MKKLRYGILMVTFLVLFAGTAFAIPSLQLNIAGGSYDTLTGTIIAPAGSTFDLYAYLIPNDSNLSTGTYYISAALMPQTGPASSSLGFFTFAGETVNVTGGMVYGTPPLETIIAQDPGDLPPHGIFDTYFTQFEFTFGTDQVTPFNTQEQPGFLGNAGTGMYYQIFAVDLTGLNADYGLHFDLYNTELLGNQSGFLGDIDVNKFAPFSHDAQSDGRQVPEAGAMLIFGSGLIGLVGYRRLRRMQ